MKIKVNDLRGEDLNRAVAMALGLQLSNIPLMDCSPSGLTVTWVLRSEGGLKSAIPNYATDIAVAWPIIEKFIHFVDHAQSDRVCVGHRRDDMKEGGWSYGYGPTVLIAAMRCFVTSKFGDEVGLP